MPYLVLMAMNMKTADRDLPRVFVEYTDMPLEQRKHHHLYHSQLDNPVDTFHVVLKTLGTRIFRWEVLETTDNLDEAQELTAYYIKEYQADRVGYNTQIDKENPRYDDHRTWEDLHGKEKADERRKQHGANLKGHKSLSEHMKRRLEVWNPMDDPAAVEKVRQSKIGIRNPMATWNYYLTKASGEVIKVECLREWCRAHPEYKRYYISLYANKGKKYKDIAKITKIAKKEDTRE